MHCGHQTDNYFGSLDIHLAVGDSDTKQKKPRLL